MAARAMFLWAILLAMTAVADADPKSEFEQAFGEEAKQVLATKQTTDDAAFAGKLLAAAKDMAAVPESQEYLYEKVLEFGAKHPQGYAAVIEAADALVALRPADKPRWLTIKLHVTEMRYLQAQGDARKEAAHAYIDTALDYAPTKVAAGNAKDALAIYRQAFGAATLARHRLETVQARIKELTGVVEAQSDRDRLARMLQTDPDDLKTRERLIYLYLTEMDDPVKARETLSPKVEDRLRSMSELASRKAVFLTDADCLALGEWYLQTLLPKASTRSRGQVLLRAQLYYSQFLETHGRNDMFQVKAKAAMEEIQAAMEHPEAPLRVAASAPAASRPASLLPLMLKHKMIDEKAVEEHWEIIPDYRFSQGALEIRGNGRILQSRYLFSKDVLIAFGYRMRNNDEVIVSLWGEKINFSGEGVARVERKGDSLYVSGGRQKPYVVRIKPNQVNALTPLEISLAAPAESAEIHMRGCSITMGEIQVKGTARKR